MSIQAVAWALEVDCPSAPAKLVLVALANYADEDGQCFPSLTKLSKIAGTTRQNVSQHIKKLIDAGLVSKQERERHNGSQASNTYVLAITGGKAPVEGGQVGVDGGKVPVDTCKAPVDPILTVIEPSPLPNGNGYTSESDDLTAAVDLWNATAAEHGLSKIQKLTKARATKLRARLKDCGGIEGWRVALSKIPESGFLLGEQGDWKANFDFMLREERFAKLMEDGYAGKRKPASDGGDYRADILAGLGLSGSAGECAGGDGGSGTEQGSGIAETGDGSGVRGSGGTAVQVGADVRPDSGKPSGRGGVLPASDGGDTGGPGGGGGVECHAVVEVGQQDAPAERSAGRGAGRVHAAPGGIAEHGQGDFPRSAASVIDLAIPDFLRRAAG